MKTRIITAIAALAIFAPILYFSATWPFTAFVCLMCLASAYEILKCCGLEKKWFFSLPTMLTFTFVGFCTRYVFDSGAQFIKYISAILCVYLFWCFAVSVFSKGGVQITDAAMSAVFCVYAAAGFCSMVFIRDFEGAAAYMFPLIFIGAWVTDTGAYFCGVTMGKHKLIPDVSPKKTVEGAIGGVAVTTLVFLLYGFIIEKNFAFEANYLGLAVMGAVIAVISMIGDLIASLVKRHYGIKDYGFIFPGHGGVLDRFDSIIAVSLFIYLLCTFSDFFILFK